MGVRRTHKTASTVLLCGGDSRAVKNEGFSYALSHILVQQPVTALAAHPMEEEKRSALQTQAGVWQNQKPAGQFAGEARLVEY